MKYPNELPQTAATVSVGASAYTFRCPRAAKSPAVTSSESPGRNTPTSSPVSEKMITARARNPAHCTRSLGLESRWNRSVIGCMKLVGERGVLCEAGWKRDVQSYRHPDPKQ